MLEEALSQIGEYLPIAIEYLINVVIIFLVGYGAVLLVGRMLGIVKSYKVKNSIASIVMFSCLKRAIAPWNDLARSIGLVGILNVSK